MVHSKSTITYSTPHCMCHSAIMHHFLGGVIQYFGTWLSFHRDPINHHQFLLLSRSSESLIFSVPFHFIGVPL